MIIGNDVLNKSNASIRYGNRTVTIYDNEIPFVGSVESRNPFVNNRCLISDFTRQSKSDKKELRGANKKSTDKKILC